MRRCAALLIVLVGVLAGGLGALPACTSGATIEEACHVTCACEEILPSRQAACETACVQAAPVNVPAACLQCLVDVEDCGRLATQCVDACGNGLP